MEHPLFIKFWEDFSKKMPDWIYTEAVKEVAQKAFEYALTADEKSALAWMKAQAKALDSSVTDEDKVGDLARVISGHIHILMDDDCTCTADQYGCAENPDCIIHGEKRRKMRSARKEIRDMLFSGDSPATEQEIDAIRKELKEPSAFNNGFTKDGQPLPLEDM
jgi:hypothetical protein